MFQHLMHAFACAAVIVGVSASPAAAQSSIPRAKAVVPDGMARLSDTLTGSYFVAIPLKRKYDELVGRLDALKQDIDRDRVAAPEAVKELDELRDSLRELREELDRTKVLVPAVQANSQVQTLTFDFGPERIIVITADRVRVVGTDEENIRCTLEKVFLGGEAGDQDAEAELAAIKVVHRHGIQPDIVGKTAAEWEADEVKFLKTPEGQALTPENLLTRKKFVDSIRDGWNRYRDFQGKFIDTIHVEGLTWQEGNSQMTLELSAKDGRSVRSVWRRHATLTVYVPKCQRIAVRGALAGLEVIGVQGALLVAQDGNHDRDYDAQFRIRGIRGDVTVSEFPLSAVEDVTGNVTVQSLEDFANSGTAHDDDGRRMYWYRALPCLIKNIGGDLRAKFGRVDLRVEDVRGRLTVENEAGDTQVLIDAPLVSAAHRLETISGTIEATFGHGALGELPLIAAVNHGTLRTNTSDDDFPAFMIRSGSEPPRSWHGIRRIVETNQAPPLEFIGLIDKLKRDDESHGLVIRTLSGTIALTIADK